MVLGTTAEASPFSGAAQGAPERLTRGPGVSIERRGIFFVRFLTIMERLTRANVLEL
jgi:hypothetical protein